MAVTKTCPSCKETKGTNEFNRNRARHDGLSGYCKSCVTNTPASRRYIEKSQKLLAEKALSRYNSIKDDPSFREKRRERNKTQYEKNRPSRILYIRNRSSKLKLKLIDELLPGEWEAMVEQCNNVCIVPGCEASPVTMDHVKPLSKGGRHHISNLQPLCGPCNDRKGVKEDDHRE